MRDLLTGVGNRLVSYGCVRYNQVSIGTRWSGGPTKS
jgi:hypothetical protein